MHLLVIDQHDDAVRKCSYFLIWSSMLIQLWLVLSNKWKTYKYKCTIMSCLQHSCNWTANEILEIVLNAFIGFVLQFTSRTNVEQFAQSLILCEEYIHAVSFETHSFEYRQNNKLSLFQVEICLLFKHVHIVIGLYHQMLPGLLCLQTVNWESIFSYNNLHATTDYLPEKSKQKKVYLLLNKRYIKKRGNKLVLLN